MGFPPFATAADRAAALAFFRGHDDGHALFHRLVAAVAEAGPFELTATRSRVALTARTRFAWCHEANDDGSLWLGFLLPRRVDSPRLRSGLAGGRWSHHVKVADEGDLDAELLGWLREAYAWDVKAKAPTPKAPRKGAAKAKAAKASAKPKWTCPRCGQRFARRGQPHSCDRRAVEELFEDHPKAVKVTQLVKSHLDTLSGGTVRMAATKTQVSFAAQRRFAWVWVPEQQTGSGPKDAVVTVALRRHEQDPRVWQAANPRSDLWTHHVLVKSGRQVDAQLKAWLAEAYGTVGAAP